MSDPPPNGRYILFLEDMLEYSRLAILFLGARSSDELQEDLKGQFAIVRALEVIGEASRNVPENIRELAPEVPWREIIAMRNRIVHHYFGVRLDIVLNVVSQDLPQLISSLERLLAAIG